MKTLVALLVASVVSSVSFAQQKLDAFNSMKKSVDLRTGICMSYVDTGSSNGTPVLLLHGYTDTSRSFQPLIEDLLRIDKGIRIIAPDLRGHGQSSMPDSCECEMAPERCFTQAQLSADILSLLDYLGISQAHIVGHSIGSTIAQTIALQHPDRVFSMTLIGTCVNGKEAATIHNFLIGDLIERDWKCTLEEERQVTWPQDAYSILPLNMGERVMNYLKENWVVEAGATEEFLDAIFPETLRVPLGTWIGAIRTLGEIDNRGALQKLRTPTLILWGEQDIVFGADDQEQVRSAFRSAAAKTGTKVIYKTYAQPLGEGVTGGPGHNFHWAAHKAVSQDIHNFIRNGSVTGAATDKNGRVSLTSSDYYVELK